MIDILTNPKHPKNAKDDHTKMLTAREMMVLCRWVDSNYQFYGSYYGRRHSHWAGKADPGHDADRRAAAAHPAEQRRLQDGRPADHPDRRRAAAAELG